LVTLDIPAAYMCKEFDDSGFNYSSDMIGSLEI